MNFTHHSQHKQTFVNDLHAWFHLNKRSLPWRTEPSLYKTVVSEFMLQQTQVSTVLPYFERWLKRFPSFSALANAQEADLVKHWEGLGYYTRARNLHKLAKVIVSLESIPQDANSWLVFPGIGPYTAAAVTSIAFGHPAPVIDGNVIRILSRLTASSEPISSNTQAHKRFEPIANELLCHTDPNTHNQAMMELGATICTRHNPQCNLCPIKTHCTAAKQGNPSNYPQIIRKEIEKIALNRAWVLHEKKVLFYKTPQDAKRLSNLFEFPLMSALNITQDEEAFFEKALCILQKKRSITNHRITESFYQLKPTAPLLKKISLMENLIWVPIADLDSITLSGPHRKWLPLLLV